MQVPQPAAPVLVDRWAGPNSKHVGESAVRIAVEHTARKSSSLRLLEIHVVGELEIPSSVGQKGEGDPKNQEDLAPQ